MAVRLDHLEEHTEHRKPTHEERCGPKVRHTGDVHDCLGDTRPEEHGRCATHAYLGQVGDEHQRCEGRQIFEKIQVCAM